MRKNRLPLTRAANESRCRRQRNVQTHLIVGNSRDQFSELAVALYAALVASDFSDAIRIASNHDGDSDSTASIAGQICGTWKGLEEIPSAWIRRLDALDPLLDVTGRLIGVHA